MTWSGQRLRMMLGRMCSARTMERLVDPIVADLQTEYRHAARLGWTWGNCWILLRGHVAFLKAMASYGGGQLMQAFWDWTTDDHRALGRVIGFSLGTAAAATFLLMIPPLLDAASGRLAAKLLVYLIPQALPLALPVGLTLGILCSVRRGALSRRLAAAILSIAVVCSITSFATLGWIMPASNQAFRTSVTGDFYLAKGTTELTLGELGPEIDSYVRAGRPGVAIGLALRYHQVWALSSATFVFALFALSVVARWPFGRVALCVVAFGAYVGYYVLLFLGRYYAIHGTLPAFAGVWLPNVVFAALAAAFLASVSQSFSHSANGAA